jgi:hypothetical protein
MPLVDNVISSRPDDLRGISSPRVIRELAGPSLAEQREGGGRGKQDVRAANSKQDRRGATFRILYRKVRRFRFRGGICAARRLRRVAKGSVYLSALFLPERNYARQDVAGRDLA